MKIELTLEEFESLFQNNQNCIVIPDWNGDTCTFNRNQEGLCYIVRWEEYDPCTGLMTISELLDYVNGDFKLHVQDYKDLF